MAQTNAPARKEPIFTHEGARAVHIDPYAALRRSVMSCMLWEDEFYEDGVSIATRITDLCAKVKPEKLAALAVEARTRFKLRHVPLLLARELVKHRRGALVGRTIAEVIQRPDELCEFLALYWKHGKTPLATQVKKGLAIAFNKFDGYQLAKYNRDNVIKLRDVLFLCHAKPKDEAQAETFKKIVDGTLEAPNTWEVALSGGADKRATFERLMDENALGGLAFLRNLRNMQEAGVPKARVAEYARKAQFSRVLPFRFISAAKYVPGWEDLLEPAMLRSCAAMEPITGPTAILVDHSGSMQQAVSAKSNASRFDAAGAVAILVREICENVRVFAFSSDVCEVPNRRGFALREAIMARINPTATRLGMAVKHIYSVFPECERLIVITDEQSADKPPAPQGMGYVINVASNRNGIGYGQWQHIDGFSEAVIDFIREFERVG